MVVATNMPNAFCYLDPTPLLGLGGVRRSKVHSRMFVPLKVHGWFAGRCMRGLVLRELDALVCFYLFSVPCGWFGSGLICYTVVGV